MLLLIAIHFHCDQLKWIYDYLMYITLGMKINIRLDSMGKIKKFFTKTIFPEKVYITVLINILLYLFIINIHYRLWFQDVLIYQLHLI